MQSRRVALILVAAGPGTRLGADRPKALVECAGRPLLAHALDSIERAFASGVLGEIPAVVVVAPPAHVDDVRTLHGHRPWPVCIAVGGDLRQDSVRAGLSVCPAAEIIVVHDAARPFLAATTLGDVIAAAAADGAAVAALPAVDTVKLADAAGFVQSTPPRDAVWLAQTPQAFHRDLLIAAHAGAADSSSTDDASLVEAIGRSVRLVAGGADARKITTPADLRWAEWMLHSGQWPR